MNKNKQHLHIDLELKYEYENNMKTHENNIFNMNLEKQQKNNIFTTTAINPQGRVTVALYVTRLGCNPLGCEHLGCGSWNILEKNNEKPLAVWNEVLRSMWVTHI